VVLGLPGDDALQDVSQVGERLNAVEFARLDQCVGCQSALNIDPRSAFNRDPSDGVGLCR
jgi:hypothetical protein